ncbi:MULTISPECIES: hypothetical protein [unclassified Methanoculleus]|uniref:hypothetical protein n=1 Tax=unclassified Methanoculleus TaxID=2619537 RepID=UPI0025E60C1D|nr:MULTISPECIES: hypothetical protein [unclassified Methanoculleus]MCK9316815.1 hypothetical protein [Methanoculleus sp.]MDD2252724.1 hypothetical protein [Methanoculleus sp.]MDD2786447.1 hypothetical protein [Methanoculleus sp.]MDD3215293.1 hypothetical protein [Methanoculleus sp.]MDD4312967.1 hypothetical protein [Methanoculleus sp.]
MRAELLIHPLSASELRRDSDLRRREVNLSKIEAYSHLERPPDPNNDASFRELVGPAKNSHDDVDNALLYAIYKNAVEFFITEDREIHKKAHKIGVGERVFLISEALYDFNRCLPSQEIIPTPPALVKDSMHNLDLRDPIFDSLRADYPGFDEWFIGKAQEGRECYAYRRTDGSIGAILIYKVESEPIPSTPPLAKKKRLKIATMKVEHVGYKIGELLLKVSIDIALKNGITEIYLTHFTQPKEDRLVDLISEYGFHKASVLKRVNRMEDVYVKNLCARGHDVSALLPVTISQIYYPSFYDGDLVKKFVIPIQPEYHDLLFTDFSKGRQTKLYEHSGEFVVEGNTIRKAYLTHSRIKKIEPGDIILFYRSRDTKAVTSVGVVDDFFPDVSDTDEVIRIIGKRSVYSHTAIERSNKPLTIILFRHHFHLPHSVTISELRRSNALSGAPQSITEIDNTKYTWVKLQGGINESYTVH